MMDLYWLLFSQLIVMGAGYTMIFVLNRGRWPLEVGGLLMLAVIFVVGLGAVSLQIFLYSWLEIHLSVKSLALPWTAAVMLIVAGHYKFRYPLIGQPALLSFKNISGFVIMMMCIILFQSVYSLLYAVSLPVTGWDAWMIWFLKAKSFFLSDGMLESKFFAHAFHNPDYPLLTSLAVTWNYICLGRVDDQIGKFIFPLTLIALWVIFYVTLARNTNRDFGLFFTALLSMIPVLIAHGGGFMRFDYVGYADLMLSTAFLGAGVFLYLFLKERSRTWEILFFLFLGLAAWTKNEGLVLAISGSAIYFMASRNWKRFSQGILIIGLFVLPWTIFKLTHSIHSEGYLGDLGMSQMLAALGRIPLVLSTMGKGLFSISLQGLVWPVFVLTSLICWRNIFKGPLVWCYGLLSAQLFAYACIYLITPLDPVWLMRTTLDRLIMHVSPLALWIAGIHIHNMVQNGFTVRYPRGEAIHGTG